MLRDNLRDPQPRPPPPGDDDHWELTDLARWELLGCRYAPRERSVLAYAYDYATDDAAESPSVLIYLAGPDGEQLREIGRYPYSPDIEHAVEQLVAQLNQRKPNA
jgi:hypothetical protein